MVWRGSPPTAANELAVFARESDVAVAHVLPEDLPALTQHFAALNRLGRRAACSRRWSAQRGTSHVRAQAEAALRDLLLVSIARDPSCFPDHEQRASCCR